VSKSATTLNLAGVLAAAGKKVLAIDGDPQASLSSAFLGPAAVDGLNPAETLAALFDGSDPFADQLIRPSGLAGVDLVPGSMAAADFNAPRPDLFPMETQLALRTFVGEVRGRYDWVVIDTSPTLFAITWAALAAADFAIVPCIPEDPGTASLAPVFASIRRIVAGPNPALRLLGLVLSMVQPRLGVHQVYERVLREQFGELVFAARIPLAADIKEAIARSRPVVAYKPRGASAKAYKAVWAEVESRIALEASPSVEEAA
jgi:chromosome partitioning protein